MLVSTFELMEGGQEDGDLTKIGEWRDTIHEDPESRKCFWRLEYTVESKDQREHESRDCARGFGIWKGRDDHVRVSRGENKQLNAE